MKAAWRLLVDPPITGGLCMGIDTAILEARAAGTSPATLRVYTWARPTASIGRFQPVCDVDAEACALARVDVVRRPTGGRGVLHDREVTYSVTASVEDGVPRGVPASYEWLCQGLVEAYRTLGVAAALTARDRGRRSAACYLHATRADVSAGKAKLSGSAQVWRGNAVLQHGSLVLERDCALEARIFRLREEDRLALGEATASLREILGGAPPVDRVVDVLTGAFARTLGVTLEPGSLTGEESRRAESAARQARVVHGREVRHRVEG